MSVHDHGASLGPGVYESGPHPVFQDRESELCRAGAEKAGGSKKQTSPNNHHIPHPDLVRKKKNKLPGEKSKILRPLGLPLPKSQ